MLHQFFWLMCLHAWADFSAQSEVMARSKNRHHRPEHKAWPKWWYWMTAHALIHGGAVSLVLGPVAGVCEVATHWLIDFGKTEKLYGTNTDQFFHVLSKIVWVALFNGVR